MVLVPPYNTDTNTSKPQETKNASCMANRKSTDEMKVNKCPHSLANVDDDIFRYEAPLGKQNKLKKKTDFSAPYKHRHNVHVKVKIQYIA